MRTPERIIKLAERQEITPYQWGASGRGAVSGETQQRGAAEGLIPGRKRHRDDNLTRLNGHTGGY